MGVGGTMVGFVLERMRRTTGGGAGRDAVPDDYEVEAALDDDASELDTPSMTTVDAVDRSAHDVGDLYGGHTPRAVESQHLDGDRSFDEGQNWLESLETDAAEFGPEPEKPMDFYDEQDGGNHQGDMKDTPVADRGSGGPGGL